MDSFIFLRNFTIAKIPLLGFALSVLSSNLSESPKLRFAGNTAATIFSELFTDFLCNQIAINEATNKVEITAIIIFFLFFESSSFLNIYF